MAALLKNLLYAAKGIGVLTPDMHTGSKKEFLMDMHFIVLM